MKVSIHRLNHLLPCSYDIRQKYAPTAKQTNRYHNFLIPQGYIAGSKHLTVKTKIVVRMCYVSLCLFIIVHVCIDNVNPAFYIFYHCFCLVVLAEL